MIGGQPEASKGTGRGARELHGGAAKLHGGAAKIAGGQEVRHHVRGNWGLEGTGEGRSSQLAPVGAPVLGMCGEGVRTGKVEEISGGADGT
jgi:X-X-X-Leu-X-X-Gly heptad repeat protein